MIKTQEEIDKEKENEYYKLIRKLGGYVMLKKPIRFRETPHSITQKIYFLNEKTNFNDYGLAKDTVLQKLRLLNSKLKPN